MDTTTKQFLTEQFELVQSEFASIRSEMATKKDLERLATKDELALVTADIKKLATKDELALVTADIKKLATKDELALVTADIKRLATKDELALVRSDISDLKSDGTKIKSDITTIKSGIKKLPTKEYVTREIDKAVDQLARATARGFERVDARFEKVDQRFDTLERKVDSLLNIDYQGQIDRLRDDMRLVKTKIGLA